MVPSVRDAFNAAFTEEKYQAFLDELQSVFPGALEFRVAETPVFVPKYFTNMMLDACESIVDIIVDPKFKELTSNAIPPGLQVPNENAFSHFIAFDFGICINEEGDYEPQLIEMQGFPTLFAYQVLMDDTFRKHFDIPDKYEAYLGKFNRESYLAELKEIITSTEDVKNVILLEIFPHQQKTKIDFYATEHYTGIKTVCITELIREDKDLFYMNDGVKTKIKRIYNRVIFDDLQQQSPEVQALGRIFFEELNVEWLPHPSWFYRISKYTLPLIRHPYVPQTYFLHEVKQMPADLENYVLKPLFSFAGQGVIIDLTAEDISNVKDPENWILQRKVKYADIIKTPDGPAKAEIRIFYFWKDGNLRPVPSNNLARLSKGKMIGVRYNKDKTWVGGSYCLFQK
ncbi:MAG: hypothetical protein ABWZ25_16830 [Chitinophagaceae bacterium]